jgi:hypothetical protein
MPSTAPALASKEPGPSGQVILDETQQGRMIQQGVIHMIRARQGEISNNGKRGP